MLTLMFTSLIAMAATPPDGTSGRAALRWQPLASPGPEGVEFALFSRRNPNDSVRIYAVNASSFADAFDPSLPTKIIVHGFLSHQSPGSGGHILKDAILRAEDANVVLVDWSGVDPLVYNTAVTRVLPQVGEEVAALIRALARAGAPLDSFHLLGHSLGGQIVGYAGGKVLGPARAGRITGLDPAGPMFLNRPPSERLDSSDAGFVDVIHTNAGHLGFPRPAGHVDFYPNGGHLMPGCGEDLAGACSHCYAYDVMREAILRPGSLAGTRCASRAAYLRGDCASGATASIGLQADTRARGTFHLNTAFPPSDLMKAVGDMFSLARLQFVMHYFQGVDLIGEAHC